MERQVARDLDLLDYPANDWVPPARHSSGAHVHDVVIVGGGQSGLATAFGLRRENVRNVQIIDRAPAGREGPWITFARMRTLRTPKYLTGPDLGIPSLTFRAWHAARHGAAAWADVERIPRASWMDYLAWYRRVLDLPVWNETLALRLVPAADGLLALDIERAGAPQRLLARKVVFANGMEGCGVWDVPAFMAALPPHRYAHTADAIDLAALRGRRIAVLGAGASALDNAGTALEAGAAGVDLFFRRPVFPQFKIREWLENSGFLGHFAELDDAAKWRVMRQLCLLGAPAPAWSLARAQAHANFRLHAASPWQQVAETAGGAAVTTPHGTQTFDFLILGTGFVVDLGLRPELAAIAPDAATWGDRYAPPAGLACPPLSRYPYLGRGFQLTERNPGTAPHLRNIHIFNWGATASMGVSAASITAMRYGVARLVRGLTRDLYIAAADAHDAAMPTLADAGVTEGESSE